MIAGMLQGCVSKAGFNALDGFVSSTERLWHGNEGRKRRKKHFHQQAKKASCTLQLLLHFVPIEENKMSCCLGCGAVNSDGTPLISV